jgi:hypothetical protein
MEHPIQNPPLQKQVNIPPPNVPNPTPPPPPDPLPENYTPPLFLKKSTIYLFILTGLTLLIVLAYYLFS